MSSGEAGDRVHFVEDVLSLLILPELQIGIYQIVHGMQLVLKILRFLRGAAGIDVGIYRLLPIAAAGEDV